jgi:hypothetical protein
MSQNKIKRMHYIGPKAVQSIFYRVGQNLSKNLEVTLCLVAENLLVFGNQEDLEKAGIARGSLRWLNLSVQALAENRQALDYVAGKSLNQSVFRVLDYAGPLHPLGAFGIVCEALKQEPNTVILYVKSRLLIVGSPTGLKKVIGEFPHNKSVWKNAIQGKPMDNRRTLGFLERDDQHDLLELIPEAVRALI